MRCRHTSPANTYRSDDDENEFGRPIYKAKKDKELPALFKWRDRLIEEHKSKIERIKRENEVLKAQGKPKLAVPTMEDIYSNLEFMGVESKIEYRETIFLAAYEDKRQRVFQLGKYNQNDGTYRGPIPLSVNPLNLAIANTGL